VAVIVANALVLVGRLVHHRSLGGCRITATSALVVVRLSRVTDAARDQRGSRSSTSPRTPAVSAGDTEWDHLTRRKTQAAGYAA
jgi:hypothetical protein